MKKTMFVVVEGCAEVSCKKGLVTVDDAIRKLPHGVVIDNDTAPRDVFQSESKEEAIKEWHKLGMEMTKIEKYTWSIGYFRIWQSWVEEREIEYDDDGEFVDSNFCGTWEYSAWPEIEEEEEEEEEEDEEE